MGERIEPQLIDRKLLRKLLAKNYKNKHFSQKILVDMKKFVIKNWYYLLIVSLICFVLYLRWSDNKKKYEQMNNNNQDEQILQKKETLVNSNSYVKDYYNEIRRIMPPPPQAQELAGQTPNINTHQIYY